jgi:hypothetical protein
MLQGTGRSCFDPVKKLVYAFAEHLVYADRVFNDQVVSFPPGIVSLPLQGISHSVTSKIRTQALVGIRQDPLEVFKFLEPVIDVSDLLSPSNYTFFSPFLEFFRTEFARNTLVYPRRTVAYPRTAVYTYAIINGVKWFLDYHHSKTTFIQRRAIMSSLGFVLLPISSEVRWDSSLVIDVSTRNFEPVFGVTKKKFLSPFRKAFKNKRMKSVTRPVVVPGFLLTLDGLVSDLDGVFVYSPSANFELNLFPEDGMRVSKFAQRAKLGFRTLTGMADSVITFKHIDGLPTVSLEFFRKILLTTDIPPDIVDQVVYAVAGYSSN